MAKRLEWGSNHPGHLVYLLDLSGSMSSNGKIDQLLEVVKATCNLMLSKCTKGMSVKNRFSLSVIGYNSDVHTLFEGTVEDLDKKMDEIYKQGKDAPMFDKTIELENGGCHPNWQTYTAKAFRMVKADIDKWMAEQQKNGKLMPVPMIIHVTDGYPEENERGDDLARADALRAAQEIMDISMPDGHPLLFNIHIGEERSSEMLFPSQSPSDPKQQFLYNASSLMPDDMISLGKDAFNFPTQKGSRLMASNVNQKARLANLITFGSTVVGDDKEKPKL